MSVPFVSAQRRQALSDGSLYEEKANMQFTPQWKKEIVLWAAECIFDITIKLASTNKISHIIADDLRFHLGTLMGRIFELHRQQMEMYRRIKRRIENKFNWIQNEMAHEYEYPNGSTYIDYRPQVYITALEFITKRELDIENIVKLVMDRTGEEEVGRFSANLLPISQNPSEVWNFYVTKRNEEIKEPVLREGTPPDRMERQEEELKANMRARYYKKRNDKNKR